MEQIIYREYIVFRGSNISCRLACTLEQFGVGASSSFRFMSAFSLLTVTVEEPYKNILVFIVEVVFVLSSFWPHGCIDDAPLSS